MPLSTAAPPGQTDVGEAEAVTFNKVFTVIVTVAVLVQPWAVVPVTVYVVLAVGLTVMLFPVIFPGCQT